jgi:hypothetical protein
MVSAVCGPIAGCVESKPLDSGEVPTSIAADPSAGPEEDPSPTWQAEGQREGSGERTDPGPATVLIDIYSGGESPVVSLNPEASAELREFVEQRRAGATIANEPEGNLGFRGFLVAWSGLDQRSLTARVVRDAVYLGEGTATHRISDNAGTAYRIVRDAVGASLDPVVLEAIDTYREAP